MKVKTLIKKLEKMDPEAEVRLHDKSGEPVLFVLCAKKYPDVWLQTEGDVDMSDEIQARFDDAIENGTDELDVYMEMLEAVKRQLKLTYDHAILSYVMSILGFLVAMILWGVMRSVLRQEAQYIPLGTIMALGLC